MDKKTVHHRRYGKGQVLQTRHKGLELLVKFVDGRSRWTRIEDLQDPPISARDQGIFATICCDDNFKSRRMIECFRLGTVPGDCVQDFIFGRDDEIEQIDGWLARDHHSTLTVIGGYGTGKSHVLQCAYARALQNDFAVAFVEMDLAEAPFCRPKRVYGRVAHSLRFRSNRTGQIEGYRSFLTEAMTDSSWAAHTYFGRLLHSPITDQMWEWIEARESVIRPWSPFGEYTNFPATYDYGTAANIYCYLLSGLGWAAKEILGLNGLLLIFDEAETVDYYYYYEYQREKSENFLRALIRTANGDEELLEPPYLSRLLYCQKGIASGIRFLFRQPSGLKLLFAFTPGYATTQISEVKRAERIVLQPLSTLARRKIFEHTCLLYHSAYGFLPNTEERLDIFSELSSKLKGQDASARLLVKGSVEALDLARLVP